MKGNFWRKIFRKGQLEGFPHSAAARYNGNMNKRDVSSTRTKLKRFLDKIMIYSEQ